MSKLDIASMIQAELAKIVAAGQATTPAVAAAVAATPTPEQREARKLALAKALPASVTVAGVDFPLSFTTSKKGKEFKGHAVVNGVKSRINGYVMPE